MNRQHMKRVRKPIRCSPKPIFYNKLYLSFGEICLEASASNAAHDKYLEKVQKLLKNVSNNVILEMIIILTKKHIELGQDAPEVVYFMEFIALYLGNVEQEHQALCKVALGNNCEMHFLIRGLLRFLIEISCADHVDTRKISLQFINILLGKLGERSVDDDIFDELTKCILERAQDVQSKVRTAAIYAGRRLQNPHVEDDLISKTYKFHMKSDPSAFVRKAGVDCIGYSIYTKDAIIARITDVDAGIRLLAFERIFDMPMLSIRLAQRHKLLYLGLRDKSVKVKMYIEATLLPSWLEQSDKSLLRLVDNIRHDSTINNKIENEVVIEKVLNVFFKVISIEKLIEELKLEPDTKLIPVIMLTAHLIIYWHRFAAFIIKNNIDYKIDLIIPTLGNFVSLIQDYDKFWASTMALDNPTDEQKLDQLDYNIGKLELLRMVQLYDYGSDEVGRVKLNDYLLHDALHQKHMIEDHYFIILKILYKSCLKFMTWQTEVLNIINEIYESATTSNLPEKVPPVSSEISHAFEVKKANIKIEMIDLQTQREEALVNKDYTKAKDCDDKLSALEIQLEDLYSAKIMEASLDDLRIESERVTTDNPESIIKLLIIFYGMVGLFNHKLTPEMLIVLEDIVIPNLSSTESEIEYWALRCVGAFCLQNKELSQKYFPLFFTKLFAVSPIVVHKPSEHIDPISAAIEITSDEYHSIPEVALQIVLDLIMAHSINSFEIQDMRNISGDNNARSNSTVRCRRKLFSLDQEEEVEESIANKTNFQTVFEEMSILSGSVAATFIKILMKLLYESELHSTRLIVVQGLVKLFLRNEIASDKIIGHLFLMYYHPEMDMIENNDIRQHIALLFNEMGSGSAGGATALINAIIPALLIWHEAPSSSPLKYIDCLNILKLIIALTSGNTTDSYCIHNDVALKLCFAFKRFHKDEELEVVLSRALSFCNIRAEGQFKIDLKSCVSQLLAMANNKAAVQHLKQVLVNIEYGFVPENAFEDIVENDVNN